MSNLTFILLISCLLFYCFIDVEGAKRVDKSAQLSGKDQVRSLLLTSKQCTQKQFDKLDVKLNGLLPFGPKPRPLPSNFEELKPWCRDGFDLCYDFEKFIKQCFTRDARDLSLIAIYSIKQLMRRYCTKKKSKATKELLEIADCLNKEVIPNQPCIDIMINSTLSIIEIKEKKGSKMKIPQLCCLYHTANRCMDGVVDKFPCLKSRREFIFDFMSSSMEPVMDVMCGDYHTDSDKCDRLPKLKSPDLSLHSSSYIMMMVEMLNSMESL